ncbi:MAG: glutaredoxin 3 [Alphaproteobacteria bacterium]|nr:MAG: glutaredoxin 3 [Alphaproteobacteria bacterium]
MQTITIYTKPWCGYCHAAKRLLEQKGLSYTEIDIEGHPERRAEMIQKSGGGMTVPQIWIGETHVGGFDDIYMLEQQGKLDPMLAV